MNTLIILWAFMKLTLASEEYQTINIYVDITEVHAPDGTSGTSIPLNLMISKEAQRVSLLEQRMQYLAAHNVWEGEINVWDWRNITYMPNYSRCNYSDAVRCGIQNGHWTLRTVVSVGDKFSVLQTVLYDEKGKVIGSSNQTAWGTIRWKPQWKLTKVKESGAFGGDKETEIFEMWPPKMEEIPPLITPRIVGQSVFGFYFGVDKSACRLSFCRK